MHSIPPRGDDQLVLGGLDALRRRHPRAQVLADATAAPRSARTAARRRGRRRSRARRSRPAPRSGTSRRSGTRPSSPARRARGRRGSRRARRRPGCAPVRAKRSVQSMPTYCTVATARDRWPTSHRAASDSPPGVIEPVTNSGENAITRKRLTTSPRVGPGQFPSPRHPPAEAPAGPPRLTSAAAHLLAGDVR